MRYLPLMLATLAAAQPGSWSYYCCFKDSPSIDGYYGDGFICAGPFRANGEVAIYSYTPDGDGDAWFYSFTLSSDHYVYGWETQVSEPHYGNLWIQPYELMQQGSPWFELGAQELPFGPGEVDWQTVKNTAQTQGLVLYPSDGTRILVDDDEIHLLSEPAGTPEVFELAALGEPVIWIELSATDAVYIKGHPDSQGLAADLTLGTEGSVFLSGDLLCSETQPGLLGIVSVYGDCIIADQPEDDPWPAPWNICTEDGLTVRASLLFLDGNLYAENYTEPYPQASFILEGGIQMQREGFTGVGGPQPAGFIIEYAYDDRLLLESPPFYPGYQLSGVHGTLPAIQAAVSRNPFSVSTVLTFSEPCAVEIFDCCGRLVRRSGTAENCTVNGCGLSRGVYLVRGISSSGQTAECKLVRI